MIADTLGINTSTANSRRRAYCAAGASLAFGEPVKRPGRAGPSICHGRRLGCRGPDQTTSRPKLSWNPSSICGTPQPCSMTYARRCCSRVQLSAVQLQLSSRHAGQPEATLGLVGLASISYQRTLHHCPSPHRPVTGVAGDCLAIGQKSLIAPERDQSCLTRLCMQ